jgi:precorrin-6Y C5,15-methyltransferase (decarboxylating)
VAKIYVIGIGYRAFDSKLREVILRADVILASARLFEIFGRYEEFELVRDKIEMINNVDATMNFVKSQISGLKSHAVILGSGDPMFCGIGRRTVEEFGKEMVEIFPDLSSVQVAFAKIKEPWDDAFLMSLHPGPDARQRREPKYRREDIPSLLKEHRKIAVLTHMENNPSAIAEEILRSPALSHELHLISMYVCEKLGYPDEKITEGTAEDVAAMEFREPNVVIIQMRN